jgi:hypothetical protein
MRSPGAQAECYRTSSRALLQRPTRSVNGAVKLVLSLVLAGRIEDRISREMTNIYVVRLPDAALTRRG